MIVTKEMAQTYLIKRACYVIQTGPEGDFRVAYVNVHWKEGMEIFLDEAECYRVMEKREQAKMSSGHCPRCNYPSAQQSEKDISYLDKVAVAKGGELFQCKVCKSAWFRRKAQTQAVGYSGDWLDYLVEWCNRDMKPHGEVKTALEKIKNHSTDKSLEMYPAHVVLNDGREFPAAMIQLHVDPPSSFQLGKKDWHYLDTVREIRPSALAYPYTIAKHIMKLLSASKSEIVYVEDEDTQKLFCFEVHAGIFMPEELKGRNLKLVRHPGDGEKIFPYYLPADRGGPDQWSLTEPKVTMIWGDM